MIINPYKSGIGRLKSYIEQKHPVALEKYILPSSVFVFDRLFKYPSKKVAKYYLSHDTFPLFQTIEIETINRCNGGCTFCPVNRHNDPRPYKMMDESLFVSIIHQLRLINYSGSLGLYSNNEPLLDKRIFSFLQIAREALPHAELYLFTNGSLLTIEKFNELMKYLDILIIDNYNDDLVLNDPIKKVHNHSLSHPSDGKVFIYYRKQNEILTNRGGQANNRTISKLKLKSTCMYPFEQVVVRPDGKLSLCCNDATGKVTMGDLTKDDLLTIWRGENYKNIRKTMVQNRSLNPLCKDCDVVTPKFEFGSSFDFKKLFKIVARKN